MYRSFCYTKEKLHIKCQHLHTVSARKYAVSQHLLSKCVKFCIDVWKSYDARKKIVCDLRSQRWCQISPLSIVFITITALWKSWWTSVHQLAPHLLHWPSSVSPESRLNTITENTFPSPQPTSPIYFIIKFNNGDIPRKLKQDLHFFCPFPSLKLVTCSALIWSCWI